MHLSQNLLKNLYLAAAEIYLLARKSIDLDNLRGYILLILTNTTSEKGLSS